MSGHYRIDRFSGIVDMEKCKTVADRFIVHGSVRHGELNLKPGQGIWHHVLLFHLPEIVIE